ncbi:hypothetical protein HZA87_03375 [Candidatus Uhrbacteria bacterium]|nr:hypothetical protein [Candidatus Uhrbacteria bacterium]
MSNHLQRILDLVGRTGDTMVVVEKDSDRGFVVMDLAHYEDLRVFFAPTSNLQPPTSNIWDVMPEAKNPQETWDPDNLTEDEMVNLEKQYEEFAKRNVKEAIQETQTVQKTVEPVKPPEVKKDEDFGEEQFYLEPVD